jgi:parallel beta-helix repeat protein
MSSQSETSKRRTLIIVLVALAVVVIGAVTWAAVVSTQGGQGTRAGRVPSTAKPTPSASASAAPVPGPRAICPTTGTRVSTASELSAALAKVKPGSTILLAPGTYSGHFVATVSGSKGSPISLCGPADAILDGGGIKHDYVVHLNKASYWHLVGFTVRNGQKGVMVDGSVGSILQGLTVSHTGHEAIHLRTSSTDNIVRDNRVSDTGHLKKKYGEGIYVGTAEPNWCKVSNCKPDRSDRNLIVGNTIWGTTAESVDIKEGTTGGVLANNSFDGSQITSADSWVDVKGDGWVIENNTGVNSPGDGFQTHEILKGWGTKNVFKDNTAHVNGPGYGFASRPALANVVECNNTVTGAASGKTTPSCTRTG